MTWEQIYQTLSDAEKMIMDISIDNRIDLTQLANLQMQKNESDTYNGDKYGFK